MNTLHGLEPGSVHQAMIDVHHGNLYFHFGILLFGMMHKVSETRSEVEAAKKDLIDKAPGSGFKQQIGCSVKRATREEWRAAPIKEIQIGEIYTRFGIGAPNEHGVDDGFHGSKALTRPHLMRKWKKRVQLQSTELSPAGAESELG